jgi:hypothetical protein
MSNGYRWEILPREGGGLFLDFWDCGVQSIGDTTLEIDADGTVWRTWWPDENATEKAREEIDLGKFLVDWLRRITDGASG